MNWILLILSGCVELGFTFSLGKIGKSTGLEQFLWCIAMIGAIALSISLMSKVIKTLPVGTAYAIWTGIGAVGTVLIGIFVFKEPATFWRLFFIGTLILSIIGLKVVSA